MSTETFGRENLDVILKELAREYRKLGGKAMPAEIILIGGAAVIENYSFREMTADIDAIIYSSSIMKEAINNVGDRLNLPNGWINDDFKRTSSYSPRLNEISVYYKSFYGVLNVRTVSAKYLIAMKLKAGRKYKNDFSDIAGILAEHKNNGEEITYEQIDKAINDLYDGWGDVPEDSILFIKSILENGNYEEIYQTIQDSERQAKEALIEFEEKYPGVTNVKNIDDVLEELQSKQKKKSDVLQRLNEIKKHSDSER